MSVFPTQLYDTTLGEPVDAEIHTELGLRATLDAEVLWAPARLARRSSIMDLGVPVAVRNGVRNGDNPRSLG